MGDEGKSPTTATQTVCFEHKCMHHVRLARLSTVAFREELRGRDDRVRIRIIDCKRVLQERVPGRTALVRAVELNHRSVLALEPRDIVVVVLFQDVNGEGKRCG